MASLNFDTTGQQEMTGGGIKVPAGTYTAKIVKSEFVDNSKGTGKVIKLEHRIMGGDYDGVIIKESLNHTHPNATAQSIGRGRLTTIVKTCGKIKINDTNELHGIPMKITVTLVDNEFVGQNGQTIRSKRNEIVKYEKLTNASPAEASFEPTDEDSPW